MSEGLGIKVATELTSHEDIKIDTTDFIPHAITSNDEFIQCFKYNLEGTETHILEPNPIVIYFNSAQGFLSDTNNFRNTLFDVLLKEKDKYYIGNMMNAVYAFYISASNLITSLMCSMEAFINSKIPIDFTIIISVNGERVEYDKYKTLRYMNFKDKIKLALPKVYDGKNFAKEKSHLFDNIKKIEHLRNNMIHTKPNLDYDVNYYDALYTEALNFDYTKAMNSAKEFINYYEDNLIEPCDCGKDH
ncbi:hypothetical protein ACYE2N_07290 [Flavobacterium sp. MAHUQ-51]|uniref:hypothetical protein n=1 Tax=Flavobacterium sp. GCM10022190 TaxID=3252639 RepID=UPI003610B358